MATRGRTKFFLSNIDGTASHLVFSIPYERVGSVVWSPDGLQIAFQSLRKSHRATSSWQLP
jgi:hypothetical protein